MRVNEKDTPLLTLVVVASGNDDSLEKRFDTAFSTPLPGLDIVLLNAAGEENYKFKEYTRIYSHLRYVETAARTEMDLFVEAKSLCKGKYFHISQPGKYLDRLFFQAAVAWMETVKNCNLVYCRPTLGNDEQANSAFPFSSISTQHYTRASRISVNMYLSTQNNYQLDGVIRSSDLQWSALQLSNNSWKSTISFDLACRGTSHNLKPFNLIVDRHLLNDSNIPIDSTVLNNQIRSICTNVDGVRDKCLLVLSALANAANSRTCA